MGEINNISTCSDSELVQKFRDTRNNTLIGELFRRYSHLVFGVCMKYIKDEDEAQDVVMQVFEKLLVDLHNHQVDNFKGWLYMVSKNQCLMYFRKKKIHVELPRHLTGEFSEDGAEWHDQAAPGNSSTINMELTTPVHLNGEDRERQLTDLENCVKELNEQQRVCIELFYLQEKSYEEVANKTGYSMKQVKSYIQNGKRNLHILLTKKMNQKKSV